MVHVIREENAVYLEVSIYHELRVLPIDYFPLQLKLNLVMYQLVVLSSDDDVLLLSLMGFE